MKLKVLFDSRGNHYLATESGEILGMFGLHDHDPEWIGLTRKNSIDAPSTAKIVIKTTKIEYISSTIEGSVVPSNALPEAARALPAPAQVVEYDYDDSPGEIGPFFHGEDCDCLECEDVLTCPDCAQPLCFECRQCETAGCETEGCDCPW